MSDTVIRMSDIQLEMFSCDQKKMGSTPNVILSILAPHCSLLSSGYGLSFRAVGASRGGSAEPPLQINDIQALWKN